MGEEALLRGPCGHPSSTGRRADRPAFLRREPWGHTTPGRVPERSEARHGEAGLEGSTAAALSTTARRGRPPTSKQARMRPVDPVRREEEALCAQRHGGCGEGSAGAGEWPGQRQLLTRAPHPPWGPRVPGGPAWACAWPPRCVGPARAPKSAWVPVKALDLGVSESPTRTGFPLNTGRHRAGPPKLALIPRRGRAPCPRCPLDAPSPNADSAAGTSSHRAGPPG